MVLSGVTLILLPKCPACLAAYVAFATGISLSTAVAGHLRLALGIACMAVLTFLVVSGLRRICRGGSGAKTAGPPT